MKTVAYIAIVVAVISLIVGVISRITVTPITLGGGTLTAQSFYELTSALLLLAIALILAEKK